MKGPEIKALRERLGLSQWAFSHVYGIPEDTLKHWESGRRIPRGSTATLLGVIARNPKLVEEVRSEIMKQQQINLKERDVCPQ